ncbi:IS110 family transposase [Siccirubricoccus sp. G192]|uniref:IS110 family transposase n=1 Tax=Siccirubricoccus sp. G192 TaxID=2849651 RepID=UPI001C2C5B84|nr:IS110 family transposase [Siccirubricoccus sp. G192]MBV1796622.1 IS110 family transposase [Siccirubricoccus sp. G192]
MRRSAQPKIRASAGALRRRRCPCPSPSSPALRARSSRALTEEGQVYQLDREIRAAIRQDQACRLLMTAPGVGCMTAVSYVAAVEDPSEFRSARAVSAWIGLTPRRYQSGEIDVSGRISRQGDKLLRSYLYEAAAHVLTRATTDSALRRWGEAVRARIGFKRAVVAVARKLAVVLHAMWKHNRPFEPGLAVVAA